MSGYFVLKGSGEKWMFNLKAGNHETILTSQPYKSRASAEGGIESVRKNAPLDERYERKDAKDGSPYFSLKAANGEAIGKSEMYSGKAARDNGIESVKRNAPDAPVKEG